MLPSRQGDWAQGGALLVELKVSGVVLDAPSKHPMVMLRDLEDRRALLIWIGEPEAQAILLGLEGVKAPRPMTHDLLVSVMAKLGTKVRQVAITAMKDQTFFAEIELTRKDGEVVRIDARPSDAIALALRLEVPVMVASEVLLAHAIPIRPEQEAVEDEAFRDFLHNVSPGDFSRFAKD